MTASAQPVPVEVIRLSLGSANAINQTFLARLDEALARLEQSEARAAVLTGTGRFFSAGLDLIQLYEFDRAGMERLIDSFKATFLRLFNCPKPIVAAINGHAIAGGCILALACDYRVMGRGESLIGMNELKHGIPLPTVALEIVRQALPAQSLAVALYQGTNLPPQKALAMHLIDELVEPSSVLQRAEEVAAEMGEVPGGAFGQIKVDLRAAATERIHARDNSADFLDHWFSDEARRRIGAMREALLARRRSGARPAAPQPMAAPQPAPEATEPKGVGSASQLEPNHRVMSDHEPS